MAFFQIELNISHVKSLKKFYYPKDYFDYSLGEPLDETTINSWVQHMFDKVEIETIEHPAQMEFFHVMSTGNTKVLLEVYRQDEDSNEFTIYVSVCTKYKQKSDWDITF